MFSISKTLEVKAEKSKTLKVKSNYERYYNVNEMVDVSNIGNLNVLKITSYKNETQYKNKTFGKDFTELIMSDNKIFVEKTYNEWYDYYLTFIEQVENNYTRIYYIDDILFKLRTCFPTRCESCREDYEKCDDCKYEGYALIRNTNKTCYLIDKLIKGYIYNETGKIFEKCYSSCDFCYSNSSDKNTHKCLSCSNGYFPSYIITGNCYLENDVNFITNSCSKYKIHSTGECVEECPTSISYYLFIYNQELDNYEKFDISPPKYLFNNQCYDSCPLYSKPDDTNICKCEFAFYVENGEITCFEDNNCLSNYSYQNPDTKECFLSLDDCFSKGNNFFFNKECYKNGCPNDRISLNDINEDQKEFIKNKILLDDNLEDKLCICNININFWSNIKNNSENELYFQKCLTECPIGFEPENLTNLCIEKPNSPSTLITTIINEPLTTKINTNTNKFNIDIISSVPIKTISTITKELQKNEKTLITFITDSIINKNKELENKYTDNNNKDLDNCLVIYNNKCYDKCPEGTCINQDEIELKYCIPMNPSIRVYNDICFSNLDEIGNNIKTISENNEIITKENGILIYTYSTTYENIEINEITKDTNFSIIYFDECEKLLKKYYNLSDNTQFYVLGIDSPNKNKNHSTNVYNYEIYLENGTRVDHLTVCKDEKVIISSKIIDTELIKLENASYFAQFGYDIYDANNSFYTDNCAPASIEGNDLTIKDRKIYFYPNDISLCNESCHYIDVNFTNQRLICECEIVYNNSNNNNSHEYKDENINYSEYFLSFISYKIIICDKLLFNLANYYYNVGFYIATGTLVFCLGEMAIFLKWGMKNIRRQILKNIPNEIKLKAAYKEQKSKINELTKKVSNINNINNPIKKKSKYNIYYLKKENIEEKKISQENNNNEKRKKARRRTARFLTTRIKENKKDEVIIKESYQKTVKQESGDAIINYNKNTNLTVINNNKIYKIKKIKNKFGTNIYNYFNSVSDDQIDKKDFNKIPFTQALRIDKRNYFEMFLSFLANEIEIVKIFYYRDPYTHISITLSLYVFESCLDFTLNCFLCNDDVVSQKFHNYGSIKILTSLTLSLMSNILSSTIVFLLEKLVEYGDVLEYIVKEIYKENRYYSTFILFRKYLIIKLTSFFIIQGIFNVFICYYLMIFCTVFHETQGNIIFNYIIGIGESMGFSLGLAIVISLIRYLSLKYKWRYMYYTSKHLFEKSNIEILF